MIHNTVRKTAAATLVFLLLSLSAGAAPGNIAISRVVIYDRPSLEDHLAGGTLLFSDGSRVSVTSIPDDGSPKELLLEPKTVRRIRFEATDGNGKNLGLSEIEVFPYEPEEGDFTSWVEPLIETTRGRWFFCTPGGRPMGMVAAHAFNRVKNQGGGGYNYNFPYILGFSQINDWMISGPNLMPVEGEVNTLLGMEGWKSGFSHGSETIRPGLLVDVGSVLELSLGPKPATSWGSLKYYEYEKVQL